ncbi:hypothetical protein BBJ28_00021009 [Nothophytophthora sp. Chile5]|nr:hypothetical protein BBJ28_00021009 [Nothophytophthora sp. Chile5]
MYGIHSPSAAHMMAKAAFSDDEVVDAQVLHELAGPTIAHPFRFLGLKWLVKAHPPAMGAVVLPRDVVYVEHTGLTTRADGSRLGHFLIHSVDLPQCPELRRTQGLVRARVSSCCLLRERADDPQRVDVFMTGRVAAQGRVLDSLALLSTANGLTYFWKAAVCAQRRKLAWRLQHKRKLPSSDAASATSASQCPRCAKSPGRAFSSTSSCEMCGVRMCSRCRVSRKLVFPGAYGSKRTHAVTVDLCTPCVTRTSQEDPVAIARQEIRAGQYGALTSPREARKPKPRPLQSVAKPRRVDFSASAGPPSTKSPRIRPNQTDLAASAGPSATRSAETVTRHSLQALDGLLDDSKATQNENPTPDERWDVLTESEDELASHLVLPTMARMAVEELDGDSDDELWTQSERTRQTADAIDALPLWQKISALQVMAETTYHFAKKNTEQTLLLSSSGCSSGAAVAPVVP